MKKVCIAFLLFVGCTISSLGQLSKFITLEDFDSSYAVVSQTMSMDDRLISILFEKDSFQYSLVFDDIGNLTGYSEFDMKLKSNFSMNWYDGSTLNDITYISKDSNYVWSNGLNDYEGVFYNQICVKDSCVYSQFDYNGFLYSKQITVPNKYDLLYSYYPNGNIWGIDSLHLKEYSFVCYYEDGTPQIVARKTTEYFGFIGDYKSYYPNGKLESMGRYELNSEGYFTEPRGKWYYYKEDGTVEVREE